jgi:hypothetical protein
MKQGIVSALVVLLICVLGVPVVSPVWRARAVGWAREEPFYRGLPRHYWEAALNQEDANLRYQALLAVQNDPASIPLMIDRLTDKVYLLREEAAVALGRFGPEASAALPALQRMAKEDGDRSCRQAAADALRRIEPPVQAAP